MGFDDFCRLTFDEFSEVCRCWREREQRTERAEWERVRMLSFHTLQPYLKKQCSPKDLMTFAWECDGEQDSGKERESVSREEARKRFERRVRK